MPGGKTVATFQKFADIVHEDIIPLLVEYCYEDFSILSKILGTKIVDESSMRVREELFAESFQDKLLPALLAPCPDIGATSQAVDSDAEGLEQDEAEVNDETSDTENENI
jgi:5-methylcytosine-specific restriction protein B